VRYFFNEKKGIFYYTADGRIDFRELVKDLAKELKMRIEMRQVGVRDEAKMIGGLGTCGRVLCCSSFMKTFEPVTIQKARRQQIVINPTKISGLCGRLMCCLAFEDQSKGRLYIEEEDDQLIED
jgi:cell fate regulator YaaT (PSP1 superfamily)